VGLESCLTTLPSRPVPPENLIRSRLTLISKLPGKKIPTMIRLLRSGLQAARSSLGSRRALALENLVLRQQLAVLSRKRKPRLSNADRLFWLALRRYWKDWRDHLVVVKPATVVRWHREGFKRYWTWKSRARRGGRPRVDPEVRGLIRKMNRANPTWGAPRIHGELLKLGIDVSQATVSKNMVRRRKPPSQRWRTFLENHVGEFVSVDFLTVPTVRFQVLFVFVVLAHDRRRVVHFNVTKNPTARWTARQITEAFPWDTAPRYLLRDRDATYGKEFRDRVAAMSIEEVVTAARSPWQSPFVERLIGSIRRECLDHVVVLNENHLRRTLDSYFDYYHRCRTHLSLGKDSPEHRAHEPPEIGNVVDLPRVGGLHHLYTRRAA